MTELLTCRKCGTAQQESGFYRKQGKPDLTWCKECYRQWHIKRYTPKTDADVTPRSCRNCGVTFRPKVRRQTIHCSRDCKDKFKNAARAERLRKAKPADRGCMHCGIILPQRMRADALFCSQTCNYGAHALQRKLRSRTGDAAKPGYLRAFICNRDRWRCGICRKAVSRKLRHPEPMCASLDHIVPVSQGGTNDLWNLRLTHLRCNLSRRNVGGPEQLPLPLEAHASV
jgi:hypothetical protein